MPDGLVSEYISEQYLGIFIYSMTSLERIHNAANKKNNNNTNNKLVNNGPAGRKALLMQTLGYTSRTAQPGTGSWGYNGHRLTERGEFLLWCADGRVRIWCQQNESMDSACFVSTVQDGGAIVWGMFSYHVLELFIPIVWMLQTIWVLLLTMRASLLHQFASTSTFT